jgi:c-di-GMP-binding flagellar brake protein YcgR
MEEYYGIEQRKYPRIEAQYLVSYRCEDIADSYDITQTKNISQGGVLVTTSKAFDKGDCLLMNIRFPFIYRDSDIKGEVVDSEKITDSVYETRIKFLNIDEECFHKIGEFINIRRGEYERI